MKRILHATDFGPQSGPALAHALRLALDAKAKLYILHVEGGAEADLWSHFPHVREILGRWGLLDPAKPPQAIEAELGLHVAKVSVRATDMRSAVAQFALKHECDLLVLWTHERHGPFNWLGRSSAAGEIARTAAMQTLFLPGATAGFVDAASGRTELGCVLIPIDGDTDCATALRAIAKTLRVFAPGVPVFFLHVGAEPPDVASGLGLEGHNIMVRPGAIVPTIIEVAREVGAGLIAMPTAGRHGVVDAVLGSTTERVLREAGAPVLAVPI